MPGYFNNINGVIDSDARYQAWCQAYEAALLASGYLEVAPDTGQLNLATMVRPSVSTYSGFRIYKTKDTINGTPKPMYYKVEYGVGGSQSYISVRRSMGSVSNGAGTLTGAAISASAIITPIGAGTSAQHIVGGGGEHDFAVFVSDAGSGSWGSSWLGGRLVDEETQEVESVDNLFYDYFATYSSSLGSSGNFSDGGTSWASISGITGFFPDVGASNANTGGNASKTLLFKGAAYRNGKTMSLPFLVGRQSELPYTTPDESAFELDVWGSTRRFLPFPHGAGTGTLRFCPQYPEA